MQPSRTFEGHPVRGPLCSSHQSKPRLGAGTGGSKVHHISYLETLGKAECIRVLALQSIKVKVSLLKVPSNYKQISSLPEPVVRVGYLLLP